jgi:mono/diheme cytochrome c family protein
MQEETFMKRRAFTLLPSLFLAAAALAPIACVSGARGQEITYADVVALFASRCMKCHAENGLMGPAPEGYRLTSYQEAISAVDRVRVVPGQPAASEIVRRVRGQSLPRMPFDGPPFLSDEEIGLVTEWVRQGARSAEGDAGNRPSRGSNSAAGKAQGAASGSLTICP